jgi:hypothetical protein
MMQQDSKVISLKCQPNVMVPATQTWQGSADNNADPHVYAYAHVIGIYHTPIDQYDVLHVRWFKYEPGWKHGWKYWQEEQLRFVSGNGQDMFGFLNPANVICSVYLKPACSQGMTDYRFAHSSMAHCFGSPTEDYCAFDLNW